MPPAKIANQKEKVFLLWRQEKPKIKDNWTLCEAIDSIASRFKDTSPYTVLNFLVESGELELKRGSAFTIYSRNKYSKSALNLIVEKGPQTAKAVAKKFGVNIRVAQ